MCLALYWALVLPFLCWGAWATPGHPHPRPHLVFFAPARRHTPPATLHARLCAPPSTAKAENQPAADSDHRTAQAGEGDRADDIAGQSVPATMVSSLPAAPLIAIHAEMSPLHVSRERVTMPPFPPGAALSIPTPPPRAA